ncbi:aminotransferase class V-fold PLP-dependent enzyme [Streptomyces sp. NPDC004647]|uniref:aminotransferase class V-fold PLP-dependent enzyme n=1 Tax=Streptomyces sp. NPDC004647 TaxID=3154671 RepID=UPI0033A52B2A
MARLLFNPGPTNTAPEVREALLVGDFSHRDPEVAEAAARISAGLLQAAGGTGTHDCVMFAGSGTAASEAIISSLTGPLLVVVNGRYAERLALIAERHRIAVTRLNVDPYTPVTADAVDAALAADPGLTHVVVVHHETTTGMLVPLREIGAVVARRGRLLVVDSISGIGGHPLDLRADNIAYCSVNPNKCLESVPGIGVVLARTQELRTLAGTARTFYLDLYEQWRRGHDGGFPYTMPVQVLFALDRGVARWLAEGVEQRIGRYAAMAAHMRRRLAESGFEVLRLPRGCEGHLITNLRLPDHIDFPELVHAVRERGYTLYSNLDSLKDGRFFVATMGAIGHDDIDGFVAALADALPAAHRPGTGR